MIDDYKMEAGKGKNEEVEHIPLPFIFGENLRKEDDKNE